jgi:large subunit ribosomal protein L2
MSTIEYTKLLSGHRPEKSLLKGRTTKAGRNSTGRIMVRHKGGGHKRRYRDVDFVYNKINIPYTIKTKEYDPNRTGFIALAVYADGEKRYVLLPQQVEVGDKLITAEKADIKIGNRLMLKNIPLGTFVYNVEVKPQGGAKLARSAGNYIEILAKDAGYVDLKMPSGEVRKVPEIAWASIGSVSNDENRLVNLGKAGRSRHLGIRPTVRGRAMNSVDHPQGGGEARGRGKRKHRKSPWGVAIDPGIKTRTPKKYSNRLIVSRRKDKRNKQK